MQRDFLHFSAGYTRRELETGSRAGAAFFEQMRKTGHKNVSGDVQFTNVARMLGVPVPSASEGKLLPLP